MISSREADLTLHTQLWTFFKEAAGTGPASEVSVHLLTLVQSAGRPSIGSGRAELAGRGRLEFSVDGFKFCGHFRELQFLFSFVFKVLTMHVDTVLRNFTI